MAKDPVCGMTVDEKTAAATASYQGQTYYSHIFDLRAERTGP
jgi:YHS domain-containing protein